MSVGGKFKPFCRRLFRGLTHFHSRIISLRFFIFFLRGEQRLQTSNHLIKHSSVTKTVATLGLRHHNCVHEDLEVLIDRCRTFRWCRWKSGILISHETFKVIDMPLGFSKKKPLEGWNPSKMAATLVTVTEWLEKYNR